MKSVHDFNSTLESHVSLTNGSARPTLPNPHVAVSLTPDRRRHLQPLHVRSWLRSDDALQPLAAARDAACARVALVSRTASFAAAFASTTSAAAARSAAAVPTAASAAAARRAAALAARARPRRRARCRRRRRRLVVIALAARAASVFIRVRVGTAARGVFSKQS